MFGSLIVNVRLRPHYAGEISKRRFHLENASTSTSTSLYFALTSNVSVHTSPEEFKDATIIGRFEFLVWGKLCQGVHMIIVTPSSLKSSVFKMILVHTKTTKFVRFEEHFRKAPFSWRISVDCRPNRRKKAAFSKLSGVVWGNLMVSVLDSGTSYVILS